MSLLYFLVLLLCIFIFSCCEHDPHNTINNNNKNNPLQPGFVDALGELVWHFQAGTPDQATYTGQAIGQMLAHNGRLYSFRFGDPSMRFGTWNASTGTEIGTVTLTKTTYGWFGGGPVANGDSIYVHGYKSPGGGGKLVKLSAATGGIVRDFTTGVHVSVQPLSRGSVVYLCTRESGLYAFDLATELAVPGSPFRAPQKSDASCTSMLFSGDFKTLYWTSDNTQFLYAMNVSNLSQGFLFQQFIGGKLPGSKLLFYDTEDAVLMVNEGKAEIMTFDARTGASLWNETYKDMFDSMTVRGAGGEGGSIYHDKIFFYDRRGKDGTGQPRVGALDIGERGGGGGTGRRRNVSWLVPVLGVQLAPEGAAPLVASNRVLLTQVECAFMTLDPTTGKILSRNDTKILSYNNADCGAVSSALSSDKSLAFYGTSLTTKWFVAYNATREPATQTPSTTRAITRSRSGPTATASKGPTMTRKNSSTPSDEITAPTPSKRTMTETASREETPSVNRDSPTVPDTGSRPTPSAPSLSQSLLSETQTFSPQRTNSQNSTTETTSKSRASKSFSSSDSFVPECDPLMILRVADSDPSRTAARQLRYKSVVELIVEARLRNLVGADAAGASDDGDAGGGWRLPPPSTRFSSFMSLANVKVEAQNAFLKLESVRRSGRTGQQLRLSLRVHGVSGGLLSDVDVRVFVSRTAFDCSFTSSSSADAPRDRAAVPQQQEADRASADARNNDDSFVRTINKVAYSRMFNFMSPTAAVAARSSAQVATVASSVLPAVFGAGGGGGAARGITAALRQQRAYSILQAVECTAPPEGEPLSPLSAPLVGFSIPSSSSDKNDTARFTRGAVVGNSFLCACFVLVHLCCVCIGAVFFSSSSSKRRARELHGPQNDDEARWLSPRNQARVRFPTLLWIPFTLLMEGVWTGSVSTLRINYSSSSSSSSIKPAFDILIAVVAGAFVMLGGLLYLLHPMLPLKRFRDQTLFVPCDNYNSGTRVSSFEHGGATTRRRIDSVMSRFLTLFGKMFAPRYEWKQKKKKKKKVFFNEEQELIDHKNRDDRDNHKDDDDDDDDDVDASPLPPHVVDRFGLPFDGMIKGLHWCPVAEIIMTVVPAVCLSIASEPGSVSCSITQFLSTVVCAGTFFIACLLPFASQWENVYVFCSGCCILISGSCVLLAQSSIVASSSANPQQQEKIFKVAEAAVMVLNFLNTIKALVDIVMSVDLFSKVDSACSFGVMRAAPRRNPKRRRTNVALFRHDFVSEQETDDHDENLLKSLPLPEDQSQGAQAQYPSTLL